MVRPRWLGAIEHQLYAVPFVNLRIGSEDSGAGRSGPGDGDADAFRRRLWNSTMDGQYPTFANTGTSGAGKAARRCEVSGLARGEADVALVWLLCRNALLGTGALL